MFRAIGRGRELDDIEWDRDEHGTIGEHRTHPHRTHGKRGMAPHPYRGSVVASRVEVLHASPESVGDPDQPIVESDPVHFLELARPLAPAAEKAQKVALYGEDPEAVLVRLRHEQALAINDHILHPGQSQFRIVVMADRDRALQRPPLNLSGAGSRHKARASECRHRQGGQSKSSTPAGDLRS